MTISEKNSLWNLSKVGLPKGDFKRSLAYPYPTGPDVQSSTCPLTECLTQCKRSMETSRNMVKRSKSEIRSSLVTRSPVTCSVTSDRWRLVLYWSSCSMMSGDICERGIRDFREDPRIEHKASKETISYVPRHIPARDALKVASPSK